MEKIKSRWRKNYLEGDGDGDDDLKQKSEANDESNNINNHNSNSQNSKHHHHNHHHHHHHHHNHSSTQPPTYEPITENLYLDKRKDEHSRSRKDARSMVCDCILTKEERARGLAGCLDDCLNRMLMIECGPKCTLGDHCLNKRFQKCQSAKVEVFKTRKKGWGLRAITELPSNSFIMEYVGEVVRSKEFRRRVKKYTKQKIKHHYFMALRNDEIIDATVKGNQTRFINHSCEPNSETQKWTVNGDLRIGFFTIKNLQPGDEITFDYQFQRYGKKAQKCYCEAPSCRGYIGGDSQTFSLNGNLSPQLNENKAHAKSFKHGLLVDVTLEDKINALAENAARGLKTRDQVIALATLSIKAEEVNDRRKLLEIIKITKSEISLKLFVDYHGLEILCLWMRDPQADCEFKATILDILEKLPIPNKTKVVESNVFRMIERWATEDPKTAAPTTTTTNTLPPTSSPTTTSPPPTTIAGTGTKTTTNTTTNSNNGSELALLPVQNINTPNIKALANKLLKKFQALSPGFKIPRLNRLQRMEIEKKMDEELIKDDQVNNDKLGLEQKTPFSRTYFKSTPVSAATTLASSAPLTTNGLVSSSAAANKINSNILPVKRRFDSLTTNNIDLTPAPKISKEEHRQQFEMHARLKDYYDAVEKHYGAAAVEQLKLSHRAFNPINGLYSSLPYYHRLAYPYLGVNHHGLASTLPLSLLMGQSLQQQQQQQTQTAPTAILPSAPSPATLTAAAAAAAPSTLPAASSASSVSSNHNHNNHVNNLAANPHLIYPGLSLEVGVDDQYQQQTVTPITHQMNHVQQQHHPQLKELKPNSILNSTKQPKPTNLPTLIVLANNSIEPAHAIDDKLAFSICDYDEYFSSRGQTLSIDDVIDNLYPYPGSYYTTPDGDTWFASVILDRRTKQPRTVIFNMNTKENKKFNNGTSSRG